MKKELLKKSAITFLVFYLIYRISRISLDIFFHHYHEWTGHDLAGLSIPVSLIIVSAFITVSLIRHNRNKERNTALCHNAESR